MNGIISIYKEKGYTSHDVVAKMRGILKIRKIGHTGTLDPDAEGVLPICIGNATKVVELIMDKDKTYKAILKLGITTDTQDMTGVIQDSRQVNVNLQDIVEASKKFIGGYQQLPPMFSAVKVGGKRLYQLARQGQEVERKKRFVNINNISIGDYNKEEQEVSMTVSCGKGTYIRTIIHDIGEELGCGATMKSLLRTRVGDFDLNNSFKLSKIEEFVQEKRILDYILPVDQMFMHIGMVVMQREYHKLIYNGNPFYSRQIAKKVSEESDLYRVYDADKKFIGVYRYNEKRSMFNPVKMFL